MILQKLTALLCLFLAVSAYAETEVTNFYHERYGLPSPYAKRVDNRGNGFENLYGVRNFREVLKGVVYRGGANNVYNKYGSRDNSNPLPPIGLRNLCQEGFGVSVYLYTTNYETADPSQTCNSIRGANRLDYLQMDPRRNPRDILRLVHAAIVEPDNGPIYLHCWNGWHASGLISALALRQFCGVSAEAAVIYWERNTDGDSNYPHIKSQIRAFSPYNDLQISASAQRAICPTL